MPFRDIVGHRRLIGLLSRAVADQSLPPSLLLTGPGGVGKRRIAGALAEVLNCESPVTGGPVPVDACGRCAQCRRIARGVQPEVIVIEPDEKGSIKIDVIRPVIERAAYRPFEGRRRVVIIDDAETIEPAAQNALLKTLEEPPPGTVFLLVTGMPDALLATVRSRCPLLRAGRLNPAEVAEVLTRDHRISERDARAVAATAEGSVGAALRAAGGGVVDARAAAARVLEQVARTPDPQRRVGFAKALVGKKSAAAERDQLAVLLRAMASLLRDVTVCATRADARVLANVDLGPGLEGLARTFDSRRGVRAFMAVGRALGALERNANAKLVADWLVLQL